ARQPFTRVLVRNPIRGYAEGWLRRVEGRKAPVGATPTPLYGVEALPPSSRSSGTPASQGSGEAEDPPMPNSVRARRPKRLLGLEQDAKASLVKMMVGS